MQITPICYRAYNLNQPSTKNVSTINFNGAKSKFIPVNTDSFNSETAKKLYSQIQKYIQIIGREGNIKNVKIMNENTNSVLPYKSDVLLSIDRTADNLKLKLSQKFKGDTSDFTILEANFDKNGQMISGFLPDKSLKFERTNRNIRRINDNESTFMPVGGNDKDWNVYGKRIDNITYLKNSVENGVYEIFMELSRLNTSILK